MKKARSDLNLSTVKKAWLMTLLDLMMLTLTFFIMLYAMRTTSVQNFSITTSPFGAENLHTTDDFKPLRRGVHLTYLEQILRQKITSFEGYSLQRNGDILLISLPISIFENVSNRILNPPDERRLQSLGETFNNISNRIILRTNATPDNLQTSLLLGATIANVLKQGGYGDNLRVIVNNSIEDGRIEIVIFPDIREAS